MLRRTTNKLSTTAAVNEGGNFFDVVVVGGGLTGCLVSSRFANENMKTLVIDEGVNLTKMPFWYRSIGAAKYVHRYQKRGFESHHVTVPQKHWADPTVETQVVIPSPKVLGGEGVMGNRSWILGDAADWNGTVWNYRDDILPRIQRFELIDRIDTPHRGKHGRFPIAKSYAVSPYYRSFTEAMNKHIPLTSSFNKLEHKIIPSCGRTEVFVDPNTRAAHTTLESYVMSSLQTKRPLSTMTESRVIEIQSSKMGCSVKYASRDGSIGSVECGMIVMAAGAIGTPKILTGSSLKGMSPEVGKNLWDCPTVVMQFRAKDDRSHHCFFSSIVQNYVYLQMKTGNAPPALSSGFDDIVAFWSSKNSPVDPDIKFTFQPFALNNRGDAPEGVDHGFQIIAELIRPQSRGTVTKGEINPNYFAVEEDRLAMHKAVEFIRAIAKEQPFSLLTDGVPVAEVYESSGKNGGTCSIGVAVNEETFAVNGLTNVYVCDGSLLPKPMIGDKVPFHLTAADKFADKYLKKKDISARVNANTPIGSGEARIIY